MIKALINPKFA